MHTIGRFLGVGAAAGMLLGAVAGQISVGWSGPYADGAFATGAMVGLVVGVVVQVPNLLGAVALSALRRRRGHPPLTSRAWQVLLLPLPTLCAGLTAVGMPLFGAIFALTTAVVAWWATPWCRAPLDRERQTV